jgi:hypothetical protein
MGHFSITIPRSLPFQCRILSSSMSLPLPTATPVILSLNSYLCFVLLMFFLDNEFLLIYLFCFLFLWIV